MADIQKVSVIFARRWGMAPKFGTSGLRGLVSDLTPEVTGAHVRAFCRSCPTGGRVFLGHDLRPSSPAIAADVAAAAMRAGVEVVHCGAVSTPALALAAMAAGGAAIMVTGSHIPADRNGLKFYLPGGEITKADEAAILDALTAPETIGQGASRRHDATMADYIARYAGAFGSLALQGLRIGVYQHSSVARDALVEVLSRLGATPVALARSDSFIPVDTEAVEPGTRALLARMVRDEGLDAVVSTDGDGDRPLVADEAGRMVPGDILGVLTARGLGAEVIAVPVTANSVIAALPEFRAVLTTRIGSPHVIAAMQAALASEDSARVVGFEPSGGFLLAFDAAGPCGPLPRLMTRDAFLPIVAVLAETRRRGTALSAMVADLGARHTASDRIAGVDPAQAADLLARLDRDAAARNRLLGPAGPASRIDRTDGLRMVLGDGAILHLRPSGNAPEFRVYAEADRSETAEAMLRLYLDRIGEWLSDRAT